jgi:acyl-CoA synthetase (AMP-forming)/AMP-acid ligase II
MNLAALLFDVARRLPQQPAVSDGRHAWNYSELARRVAGIAGGLRAYGLEPGDRVLLSLENCGEFFELLFGCWAAGLCAVPANARLHPREVEYVAENSRAPVGRHPRPRGGAGAARRRGRQPRPGDLDPHRRI